MFLDCLTYCFQWRIPMNPSIRSKWSVLTHWEKKQINVNKSIFNPKLFQYSHWCKTQWNHSSIYIWWTIFLLCRYIFVFMLLRFLFKELFSFIYNINATIYQYLTNMKSVNIDELMGQFSLFNNFTSFKVYLLISFSFFSVLHLKN